MALMVKTRAFARHDPRQARVRMAIAIGAGLVTAWAIPARLGTVLRAVAGWED